MNSVEFLTTFHPQGPWVLTAIAVSGKGIETITLGPKQAAEAAAWIKERNGKSNLYFSVNRPNRILTKKALREDIHEVGWLHVDIDVRVGEPFEEELRRIHKLLFKECPVPKPTLIVFSGGGYQAFWRLKEPVVIEGRMDEAEEIARYNKQLEIVLGGDSCSNVDRIMRLADTLNIPNARKVERGRVQTLAEVKRYSPKASYDLTDFTPAPKVQIAGSTSSGALPAPSGNIARLETVDELDKWKVPDRVKVIIVQGLDPDEPKPEDNSRSAWLFDACCQLLRAGVPEEVVFSVITDPDLGISSSVLDKAPRAEEYAMRQIQRALEEIEEPWLRILNERFFVVGNIGGKCRVMEEVFDPIVGRTTMTRQTFGDFRNRYSNQFIQAGKRAVSVAQWWLVNNARRQFDHITFSPGKDTEGSYNLWQGFAFPSIPGNQHESYLEHVFQNICQEDETYYRYVLGWMARAVQKPDSPGQTAVVLRGKSGTGKSFFANQFGRLWGRHFLQVSDAKHLVGAFNAHLRDCVVLFGDEAFYAGDKKHESVLKTLITEERMIVEQKGVDAEVSPNFTHLILASNSDWVVPTGATERRFLVLDVGDNRRNDSAYFGKVQRALEGGGYQNLLHFFLQYDIQGFDVRKVPSTAALLDQKIHSMTPMQEWWFYRLQEGTLLQTHDTWCTRVPCEDLFEDYVEHNRRFNVQRNLGNKTRLGRFLANMSPEGWPRRHRETTTVGRPYVYEFPPLRHLRDKFDDMFGSEFEWAPVEASEEKGKVPF